MTGYRSVLRSGEFRAVLAAHVCSMLSVIVADVALSVLVYQRTGSPLLAALTFAAAFVPMGIGAVLLGGIGRGRPTRDVLVACHLVAAGLVALLAVPGMPVPALLALLAAKGLLDPVFTGTRTATLPELVGEDGFPLGRSLLRMVSQNAQFVGFPVGGVALLRVAPAQALLAAAGGYAASAVLLLVGTRRRPPYARPAPGGPLTSLRVLLSVPGIGPVLALSWVPVFFAVAPEAVAIPYADVLGGGTVAVGLLLSGLPAGAVLGELLAGSLIAPADRVAAVVPLAVAGFVPVLIFAAAPPLAAAVVLLVLAGAATSYHLGLDQIALATVPEEVRRHAFTILGGGMMVSQGLGFAAAGALAERLPVPVVLPVLAGTGLLLTLAAGIALRRGLRSPA